MLCNEYIVNMLHLGRGMFGSDYGTTAFIVSNTSLNRYKGFYKKFFERQGAVETEEAKQKKFLMELKIMQQYKSYIYLYQTILLRIGQQNHLQMPSNLE